MRRSPYIMVCISTSDEPVPFESILTKVLTNLTLNELLLQ